MRRQRVCAKFIRFKEMAFLNVENKNDCFPKPSKGRLSSISQWSIISDATSFNVFIKLSNADNSSLLFPWKKKKKAVCKSSKATFGFQFTDLFSRTGRGDGNKPRQGVTEARGNPKSKILYRLTIVYENHRWRSTSFYAWRNVFSRVHRASIKLISQSIESRSCSSLINTSK